MITDEELRKHLKLLTPLSGFDPSADEPLRGWAYYLEVPGALSLAPTESQAESFLAEHVFEQLKARVQAGGTLPVPIARVVTVTRGGEKAATTFRYQPASGFSGGVIRLTPELVPG